MSKYVLCIFLGGCALFTNPLSMTAPEERTVTKSFTSGWLILAAFGSSGYRQEWIVTPTGMVVTGAPFGLACELSYRCLVQTVTRQNGVDYLVTDSQVYRYDPQQDTFELVVDLNELHVGPGTPEGNAFTVLSVNHRQVTGMLLFQETWQLVSLQHGRVVHGYPANFRSWSGSYRIDFVSGPPVYVTSAGAWQTIPF